MLLHINDSVSIGDLQDKFSRCYPNLQLVFCKKKHRWEGTCPESEMLTDERLKIGSIRKEHKQGLLELKSWFKVGEVEKAFHEQFDLNVQICFRSGNRWIQTAKMDNLTIRELQNSTSQVSHSVLL